MKISAIDGDRWQQGCDCVVVGVDTAGRLGSQAGEFDAAQGGWLRRAVARGDLSGKRGDTALLPAPRSDAPASLLVVGTGDPDQQDDGGAFEIGAAALRRLSDRERGQVVLAAADLCRPEHLRALVSGAIMGTEGQDLHQTKRKLHPPKQLLISGGDEASVAAGTAVGESINLTRRLVNEPANIMYPAAFAERAVELGEQYGLEVEVWDEDRLRAERCEALLAVGRASTRGSRLVILRYRGGDPSAPAVALVGKGVTFDSGGLSLKPSPSMVDMKCDMAGAATILGTILAAARLGIPENIVAYCGLAENMIAGDALKLGDVIRTRSGKTIEILNTDAEGRVVLADVLNVAVEARPRCIIDLATLTGACMVALGTEVCGLFSNDDPLVDRVRMAAEIEGEPVWQMPMFAFYAEQIRSKVADLKNMGDGRWAGAITAAKFLEEFVDDTPWVHIDIAGPAFAEAPKPHRDAGATGVMLRTLTRLLETPQQ